MDNYFERIFNYKHVMKQTRGGKREGSGAKAKGNVQYKRNINPEFVPKMDEYLKNLKTSKL